MSEPHELLDAIDRARDEAIVRAFQTLVSAIAGGQAPDFGRTLRSIQGAHKAASDAARKLGADGPRDAIDMGQGA